jgi:hypothetical protein
VPSARAYLRIVPLTTKEADMNATPTGSDLVEAVGRRWVAVAAFGALACALSPILPLLSVLSWAAVFNGTFPAGIVLTGVALWTTRGRPTHPLRLVAVAALLGLLTWAVMFVALLAVLVYG